MRYFKTKEKFDWYVNYLIELKKDFEVVDNGHVMTAIWNKEENLGGMFRNSRVNPKTLWIYAQVNKDCKKYLLENNVDELSARFRERISNSEKLNEIPIGYEFYSTYVHDSYWRMAYLRKYISEKLYKKLCFNADQLTNNPLLKTRMEVFSSFMTETQISKYKSGVLIEKTTRDKGAMVNIYKDIKNRVFKMMYEAKELCGDGFISYHYGRINYDLQYRDFVEGIIKSYNFEFDTEKCSNIGKGRFLKGRQTKLFH